MIGGSLTLRWKPSSLPQYALQTKIWYIVEQRIPPDADWTKLVSDLTDTELRVKYATNKDYYFRVRAANEFGIAEPSMPVMMRKKEGKVVFAVIHSGIATAVVRCTHSSNLLISNLMPFLMLESSRNLC